jgi:hypothetical protein
MMCNFSEMCKETTRKFSKKVKELDAKARRAAVIMVKKITANEV